MPIIRQKWITREDLRNNRDRVYVFGDNMIRQGYGGQAASMRGEPNSFGIPTKWFPNNDTESFFTDQQFSVGNIVWWTLIGAFSHLREVLIQDYTIVIPTDGLGTGLSRLPELAPKIAAYIEQTIAELEDEFGTE